MKNQKGYMVLGLSFLISLVALSLAYSINNRFLSLAQTQGKARAFFRAQNAIDDFSKEIKFRYEIAQKLPDSDSTGVIISTPFSKTLKDQAGQDKVIEIYKDSNELCTQDHQGALPGSKVCLKMQDISKSEPLIKEYNLKGHSDVSLFSSLGVFLNSSWAQTVDDPGPPNANGKEVDFAVDFAEDKFKHRYVEMDCPSSGAKKKHFCLRFKFCIKRHSACASTEFVEQSIIISEVPTTSQQN